MMHLSGGCLCGEIRYEVDGKPLFTALCHCRHCQKQSGSAFSVILGVRSNTITVHGAPKTFPDSNDVGRAIDRQFCSTCGSALFSIGEGAPGVVFVKAGTLDNPSSLAPQMELWTDSQQPWLKLDLAAKRFPQQPA